MTRKAKVVGRTEKKPKKLQKKSAVNLQLDVHRELTRLAADLDLTLSEIVAIAVDEYLGRRGKLAAAKAKTKARKAKKK